MKRYKFYAITCCLLLAAACHRDDDDKLPTGKYPLEITAHLADGFSRSVPGKDTWTNGEEIGLEMSADGTNWESYPCTIDASGNISATPPLYWEDHHGSIYIHAWYPGGEGQKYIDISDQSGSLAPFDYLEAKVKHFEFGQPIELQFKHVMAKVRVELTTAVEVQKVEIRGARQIIYYEGDVTTAQSKGAYVTACREPGTNNFEALVPDDVELDPTDFIKVTAADNKEYFYSAPGGSVKLTAGKTHVHEILIAENDIVLTNENINITGDGTYRLTGNGKQTTGTVTVNGNATIILDNVNIYSNNSNSNSPIKVTGGTPTFVLVRENRLEDDSYGYAAALNNAAGTKITIQGAGSLEAIGGRSSAGIGCNYQEDSGEIIIKSGTITARGGWYAAGIGGGDGYQQNCAGISILGGKVTAYAGIKNSEGTPNTAIGAGRNATCSRVTLANCEIHVPGENGSPFGYNGIWANTVIPSRLDKDALTAAGVKIYVDGEAYN